MGKEIWILDDDSSIHRMIEEMIVDIRNDNIILLKSFDSAYKVLEEIKFKTPDILLVDLYMPIFNGIELLQTLRASEKYDHLKIYVISNSIRPDDIKDAWKTELITDYIPKPIMINDLEEILA